jgi:hypothetical protein
LDPIRLSLASVVIGFVERLTLLFGNADLPIANDTRMTAPTSAKAELANLKFEKYSAAKSAGRIGMAPLVVRVAAGKALRDLRGAWWT